MKQIDEKKITAFEIDIEGRDKEDVDKLILGLVRTGHEVYLSMEETELCFMAYPENVLSHALKPINDLSKE